MRHAFVAALVIAIACACGGFTSGGGGLEVPDSGGGIVTPPPDAGDAGSDAGADAGDSGTNVTCAATGFPNPQVLSGCDSSGVLVSPQIVFNQNLCTVSITFPNAASPCTGSIHGANDAFDGGCAGDGLTNCTATSLPGTIVCPNLNGVGTCNIKVCSLDAGGCN
jgi:hypothetical protein